MLLNASPIKQQNSRWITISIICLFAIGFIIASTIILSLIPLFLPTKSIIPYEKKSTPITKSFNISDSNFSGLNEMNVLPLSALSYVQDNFQKDLDSNPQSAGSKINILSGTINRISSGRSGSQSDPPVYQLTITFTVTYSKACNTLTCQNHVLSAILNQILTVSDFHLSTFVQLITDSQTTTTSTSPPASDSGMPITTTTVSPSGAGVSVYPTAAPGRRKRRSFRNAVQSSHSTSFMPVAGCLIIGDNKNTEQSIQKLHENHPFIKLLPRDIETIPAVEGEQVDLYGYLRENKLSKAAYNDMIRQDQVVGGHYLTSGALGCLEAHVRAWTRVLEINQPMLVLEHDVTLEKGLFDDVIPYLIYSLPTNFSLLYFGNLVGDEMKPNLTDYSDLLWKMKGANWGTYAYLISPKGAATLLDLIYPVHAQVDSMIINIAQSESLEVFMSKQKLVRTDNSFGRTSATQRYIVPPIVIPRIFHFIWLSKDGLTASAEKNIDLWRKLHPDWEVKIWTNETIAKANIVFYNKNRLEHSARSLRQASDIIRYDILYQYGGVYADVDFEPLKSIEPILHGVEAFVAHENEMFVCNGIFGAIPGHKLTERLVTQLESNWKANEDSTVNKQSGPYHMTEQVNTLLNENPNIRKDGFQIFAPHVFFPYAWYETDPGHPYDDHAYAVHHFRSYGEIERDFKERI